MESTTRQPYQAPLPPRIVVALQSAQGNTGQPGSDGYLNYGSAPF